ncbi:MAG: hypothetical protein MJD61_01870 [Proteobacteria bacterium]|nr:hypothetical protein [Pseudomonadota bacterium]
MTKLTFGIPGLLTSLVLFSGFSIVEMMSADESAQYFGQPTIDFVKANKPWLFALIVLLFLGQQLMLRWPKTASPSEVDDMRLAIAPILESLLERYNRAITQLSGLQVPAVRTNIMLPTGNRVWKRYLAIYYWDGGPARIAFPEAELNLRWMRQQGTCGSAWSKKRATIFDSEDEAYQAPAGRLTDRQKAVVGQVRSVLSVPIWSDPPREVIGILNLDSRFNIDRTLFHHQDIAKVLEASARSLGKVITPNGVAAN